MKKERKKRVKAEYVDKKASSERGREQKLVFIKFHFLMKMKTKVFFLQFRVYTSIELSVVATLVSPTRRLFGTHTRSDGDGWMPTTKHAMTTKYADPKRIKCYINSESIL